MFERVKEAVSEILYWTKGVIGCVINGAVYGVASGGIMGAGMAALASADPPSMATVLVGTLLGGGAFGLVSAGVCGLARALSEDAGDKTTAAAKGLARSTTLSLGIPIISQIYGLVGARAGWQKKHMKSKRRMPFLKPLAHSNQTIYCS